MGDLRSGHVPPKIMEQTVTTAGGSYLFQPFAMLSFAPRWSAVGEVFGTLGENKAIPKYRLGIRWEPSQYAVLR